ncbi:MAG TPA: DUF488 domain-containing protein [Bryobacteraceae bacterium]|nr:DUF488 domain-containing protein [Bryobacteraceae bacterium]
MILTVGHSTRPIEEFIALLRAHGVRTLVDIRTVPRSRHNPQFNRDTLPESLKPAGIAYRHLPSLGGLRHPRADSPNTAWRSAGFRGFADYMRTREFAAALEGLIHLSERNQIAIMCAEAVPWRCHRSLVSDALAARGVPVGHILSPARREPHALTSFAQVEGTTVTYPANPEQPSLLHSAE